MRPKVLFAYAILFAVLAAGIYFAFLRQVSAESASAVITKKTFKPAGTFWQYPVGADRSLRTATEIPIAEAYVFEIAADGIQGSLFFSLNVVASREFEVGQRVRIVYRRRGLPFIWSRIFIEKMLAENR
jgi:hypothetical protein